MKRKIFYKGSIFIIASCNLFFSSYAQVHASSRALQIQLEVFGPAGLFSVNFDSRFTIKESGLGLRFGIGGLPLGILGESCNRGAQISLPAGLNYLISKKNHFLELGAGGVLAIISGTKRFCPDLEKSFFSDETVSYKFVSVGYRYQPFQKKGITYRVFTSPLFQKDFSPKLWGGFSVGYRF